MRCAMPTSPFAKMLKRLSQFSINPENSPSPFSTSRNIWPRSSIPRVSIWLFPPRLLSLLRIIHGAIAIYSPRPNPPAVRNACRGYVDNSPLRSELPTYPPPLRRRRGDILTLVIRGHFYFGLTSLSLQVCEVKLTRKQPDELPTAWLTSSSYSVILITVRAGPARQSLSNPARIER